MSFRYLEAVTKVFFTLVAAFSHIDIEKAAEKKEIDSLKDSLDQNTKDIEALKSNIENIKSQLQ